MTNMENIKVYKGNDINNNQILDKNAKINENIDNMDISIGLTLRSTKLFSNDNINNNITQKSIHKKTSIKKTLKNLKNQLFYIGDIEQAKTHSKANRPLKKVGEFDSKTIFCKCCGLPCEKEGVMEKYSFRDNTEEFIKHGQIISLYFSFYIYSIFILSYVFFAISLPTLILTYQRTNELNKICNDISDKIKIDECFIYLNYIEKGSSYSSILDFSGLNIKNYKKIYSKLYLNKNDDLDKLMVNYSVINFIGLITMLFINLGYILLLKNQTHLPDIDNISPRKYSIIITEMDGLYSNLKEKFLSDRNNNKGDINEINNKKTLI